MKVLYHFQSCREPRKKIQTTVSLYKRLNYISFQIMKDSAIYHNFIWTTTCYHHNVLKHWSEHQMTGDAAPSENRRKKISLFHQLMQLTWTSDCRNHMNRGRLNSQAYMLFVSTVLTKMPFAFQRTNKEMNKKEQKIMWFIKSMHLHVWMWCWMDRCSEKLPSIEDLKNRLIPQDIHFNFKDLVHYSELEKVNI